MKYVVDTNVLVAANGKNTHADEICQSACIDFLIWIVSNSRSKIFLDSSGYIFNEYRGHMNYHGQPGTGDIFFKYLHDFMYHDKKVKLVPISPIADNTRGFVELPANSLDNSDRKFLATAINANADITNATDTDWHIHNALVAATGITVKQLCPQHGCTVTRQKAKSNRKKK